MKKVLLLLMLCVAFLQVTFAQTVPRGMNYQAVARDLKGQLMVNSNVELKIKLFSSKDGSRVEHYSESHSVVTNKLGLFTLVVGEGAAESGEFAAVPWSTSDIWMEIQIKENGQADFATISNSKLLAVPYAYYSATAGQIIASALPSSAYAHGKYEDKNCPCEGGLSQIKVLYLGSSGVTVNVYRDKYLRELLASFSGVNNGAILTINAQRFPDGKLKNETFFQLITTAATTVTEMPTECEEIKEPWELSLGETFGNFSMLSHLDRKNGAECTVCDIRMDWKVGGNALMDMCNMLGTKSNTDVVFITNNVERFRIYANGNATLQKNLLIGGRLTVDSATDLNASLNVDGPTDLNSRLYVNTGSPTLLTGTLKVKGITDLDSGINVNGINPTVLTGTLRTDKDATFNSHVLLTDSTLQSTSTETGALVVNGGFGLGGNLNVGGDAAFGGKTSFGGQVKITDNRQATDDTSGALVVYGGAGIGRSVFIGETLNVAGNTALNSATGSTASSNGALTVAGGVGIGQNLNVGGTLTSTGAARVNNTLVVNATAASSSCEGGYAAEIINNADANGLKIKIGTGESKNCNHFVTFENASGAMVGRIQGETVAEMKSNNGDYKGEDNQYTTDIIFGSLDAAFGAYEVVVALSEVLQSVSSSTACIGFGACVTTPIPSFIVGSAAQLVLAIAAEITTIAALVVTADYYSEWKDNKVAEIGVTYESGAGDYAEYLPRAVADETFRAGDIVGVKGGLISKNVTGAEKVMVISSKPIVLGNMPSNNDAKGFEKVAFLGQVPVKVFGNVKIGDYILPNGNNNGVGIAVSPADIKSKDIKNIVGIAWTAATGSAQIHTINVAVGLNVNDNQKVVNELQEEVNSLKNQIAETNRKLDKLLSGNFAPAASAQSANEQINSPIADDFRQANVPVPDASNVTYHELTTDEISAAADMAEKLSREKGIDVEGNVFWKKFKNDPEYKASIIKKIQDKVHTGIEEAKKMNIKRYAK